MADKKIYSIDEQALREKFSTYSVGFDPASLDFLDNEVAHVKTHQPILELPEAKNIVKFIAIPVTLLVIGSAAYFGYGYVKNKPPIPVTKDTIPVVKTTVKPKEEEIKIPDAQVVNTATVAAKDEEKKPVIPAVVQFSPTPTINKVKNTVKNQVQEAIAMPKKDSTPATHVISSIPVSDTIGKKVKSDSSTEVKTKDTSSKKKKRKHKNALDVTDEIRQSSQKPSNSDDDVVVPDN